MSEVENPQTNRRFTRSYSSSTPNSKATAEAPRTNTCPQSLPVNDLVYGDGIITYDELLSSFPGRRSQIIELVSLIGSVDSPMLPLFVYGGASTGKTTAVLQILRHLNRPFIYSSCVTCYNTRILFESILNQIFHHRKHVSNGYSSIKRCDKPSDFVNLLREGLVAFTDSLKGKTGKSSYKMSSSQGNGNMIYLIFDNIELVRDWEKNSAMLSFLFNLDDILKMPEVGLIFISKISPDAFQSDTGHTEPLPIYFPSFTEDDLRQILMKNQANPKLYSSFLDLMLKPFYRLTNQVNELATVFSPLFKIYCEPLDDLVTVPTEEVKRKLFNHVQPYISIYLNETSIPPQPLMLPSANKYNTSSCGISKKLQVGESLDEINFHMSTCAKYLLISAFLASRNPATLDAALFDSTGGSDNRKRKRKISEKSMEQKDIREQELLMKGPGTFPLERLLAIYQCLTSVGEDSPDGELQYDNLGGENCDDGLMYDILLQLSSLCNTNFITKGGNCPLEGSIRYRSTVSEELALKVARSLKFSLSKYLYRR